MMKILASFCKHIFTILLEYSYGFHRLKKDQCDYCTQLKNKSEDEKLKSQHDLNELLKKNTRNHKKHKKKCKNSLELHLGYTIVLFFVELKTVHYYYNHIILNLQMKLSQISWDTKHQK